MGNELSFLGLCRKAGALAIGEELTGAAARAGSARVILLASDASENAAKRAGNFAEYGKMPLVTLPYTKEEIGGSIGKAGPAMLAVTDIGMAANFVSKLAAAGGPEVIAVAEALRLKAERTELRRRESSPGGGRAGLGKRRKKV